MPYTYFCLEHLYKNIMLEIEKNSRKNKNNAKNMLPLKSYKKITLQCRRGKIRTFFVVVKNDLYCSVKIEKKITFLYTVDMNFNYLNCILRMRIK